MNDNELKCVKVLCDDLVDIFDKYTIAETAKNRKLAHINADIMTALTLISSTIIGSVINEDTRKELAESFTKNIRDAVPLINQEIL